MRPQLFCGAGALACVFASGVEAAPRPIDLPGQPVQEALLALALQTGVSLGGELNACRGRAPALRGVRSLRAALEKVTAGSGCGFEVRAGGRVVRIFRLAAASVPAQSHAAPPAGAAPPRPPPAAPVQAPASLAEVVVTSPKRMMRLGGVPGSISVVPAAEFQARSAADLAVALQLAPGFMETNLGPGRDKFILRGLSDGSFTGLTQSTVGLYLDEVPVTYNAPDPDLRLTDVERIEVLRGPQGALYGAGSISGVVKVVTRAPDLSGRAASIASGLEATRLGGVGATGEASLNVPIVPGRLALRAGVYGDRTSGYIDREQPGGEDVNLTVRKGARAAVKLALGEGWSLTGGGAYQTLDSSDSQYVWGGQGAYQRPGGLREPQDNDFVQGFVTLERQGPGIGARWSSAFVRHEVWSIYDATPAAGDLGQAEGTALRFGDLAGNELLVSELNLYSPAGGRLHWLAGAFVSRYDQDTDLSLEPAAGPSLMKVARSDHVDEYALFGQAGFDLTPDLTVSAGMRLFKADLTTRFAADASLLQRRDRGASPMFAARYQAGPQTVIFMRLAQGYRPGGFNTPFPLGGESPSTFAADRIWTLETGMRRQSVDGRFVLEATAFHSAWSQVQSDQFLSSGLPYTTNLGDGQDDGVELQLRRELGGGVSFGAAGVLADPRLTRPAPAFAAYKGDQLPGPPRVSGSASVSVVRPVGSGALLRMQADIGYVGHSDIDLAQPESFDVRGYVTSRFSAELRTGPTTLRVWIDNPLGQSSNTFAFGNPFLLGRTPLSTPMRPTTVGVNLQHDF